MLGLNFSWEPAARTLKRFANWTGSKRLTGSAVKSLTAPLALACMARENFWSKKGFFLVLTDDCNCVRQYVIPNRQLMKHLSVGTNRFLAVIEGQISEITK